MEEIRTTIFNILDNITYPGDLSVGVSMIRPEEIETFPSITYYISQNSNQYDLDKAVGKQDIEVVIDIWTNDPSEGDTILLAVENAMKSEGYLLNFSSDIMDPSGISHITTRFNF